jgi:glycosyltransferase involved in cell wall biosynthesis
MSTENLIHHCYSRTISAGGGVKTYVDSLLDCGLSGVSNRLITSLKDVNQKQLKLLHFHDADMLTEFRGECPAVYTLHNHKPYCPSGTKYLKANQSCCDREMSYLACTWGHLVDGCGSRRPQNIFQDLQESRWQLDALKKLRVSVIANSDYVRRHLVRNGLPPEQTLTLRNGIAVPRADAQPLTRDIHQQQRILFVGRIVPEKGLSWLLKALQLSDPQIQLDIAGEGWAQPQMQKLAKQLGLSNRVTWHGWCNRDQLEALYHQCFSVIFPSIWPEPAGLVTLEAYAHCRPVIASAVGGIPEHVRHGETGILVSANDVRKLVAAITELSSSYQKSRQIGEQGYAWFLEEFTLEVHVARLQKIYEKTVSGFLAKNMIEL